MKSVALSPLDSRFSLVQVGSREVDLCLHPSRPICSPLSKKPQLVYPIGTADAINTQPPLARHDQNVPYPWEYCDVPAPPASCSLVRSKRMIFGLCRSNLFSWFSTFTFAHSGPNDYSAVAEFIPWLRSRCKEMKIKALAVPEISPHFIWHVHVLFSSWNPVLLAPAASPCISNPKTNAPCADQIYCWPEAETMYGRSDMHMLKTYRPIPFATYLTKTFRDPTLSKHYRKGVPRYFVLPRKSLDTPRLLTCGLTVGEMFFADTVSLFGAPTFNRSRYICWSLPVEQELAVTRMLENLERRALLQTCIFDSKSRF